MGKQDRSDEMYSWFAFDYKSVGVQFRFYQPLMSIIRFLFL